jgi:mannose-6-phosphate isomerase-like protein (cupin superfamily)
MSYQIQRNDTVPQMDKYGIHLNVYSDINENCGVVLVSTEEGHNQEFYDLESTFTYIILEGSGTYYLDDEEVPVSKGDMLSIGPKTRIYYKGTMKMVLITTPAWRAKNEVETRPTVW